ISLRGSKPRVLAFSSQKGVPVSGLKCQLMISRTCASRRSRAWLVLACREDVIVVLMRAKILHTGCTSSSRLFHVARGQPAWTALFPLACGPGPLYPTVDAAHASHRGPWF